MDRSLLDRRKAAIFCRTSAVEYLFGGGTVMLFAHAGNCDACLANDLLVAKAIGSGRTFFVCAACSAAGFQRPTSDLPAWEQFIKDRVQNLAPNGWTLALASEVDSRLVEKEVDDLYEDLIAWYPGFQFRSKVSAYRVAQPDRRLRVCFRW